MIILWLAKTCVELNVSNNLFESDSCQQKFDLAVEVYAMIEKKPDVIRVPVLNISNLEKCLFAWRV